MAFGRKYIEASALNMYLLQGREPMRVEMNMWPHNQRLSETLIVIYAPEIKPGSPYECVSFFYIELLNGENIELLLLLVMP